MVAPEPTNVRSLADRIAEDYAPAWLPSEGDTVIGFVSEISVGTSDFGDYPIVTLTLADGTRAAIHGFHTVLREALIENEPGIGEEIAVKYMGRILPRNKRDVKGATVEKDGYENYRVVVARPSGDTWGKFRAKRAQPDAE